MSLRVRHAEGSCERSRSETQKETREQWLSACLLPVFDRGSVSCCAFFFRFSSALLPPASLRSLPTPSLSLSLHTHTDTLYSTLLNKCSVLFRVSPDSLLSSLPSFAVAAAAPTTLCWLSYSAGNQNETHARHAESDIHVLCVCASVCSCLCVSVCVPLCLCVCTSSHVCLVMCFLSVSLSVYVYAFLS